MAKTDKIFEWTMHGMISARNIVKEKGLEELEKEIRLRGLLKVPITITKEKVDKWAEGIKENMYNNMLTATLYALHEEFGFGKERLKRFRDKYNDIALQAMDLDWLGQHYVSLEDYATELNEKYDMKLDSDSIGNNQNSYEVSVDMKDRCKLDRVLEELRNNGYSDAAAFLERKIR